MAGRSLLLQIMLLGVTFSFTLAQMKPRHLYHLSDVKEANDEVQDLLDGVRKEVDKMLGFTTPNFELMLYKTQVVAGVNYFAKIDIGEDHVIHAKVFRNLNNEVSLISLQYPKTPEDEIIYF